MQIKLAIGTPLYKDGPITDWKFLDQNGYKNTLQHFAGWMEDPPLVTAVDNAMARKQENDDLGVTGANVERILGEGELKRLTSKSAKKTSKKRKAGSSAKAVSEECEIAEPQPMEAVEDSQSVYGS